MLHYLDETTMAYTACKRLLDNGIAKVETTENVDRVDCEDCVDAVLAEWEAE